MNTNSESNVRRSSRLNSKKRSNKINYKELEEGKEFEHDEESVANSIHKDYEAEVLSKMKKKGEVKLSHPKKSLTAYTLFVKLKRKELQEKYPDATTPELMKEIGRQWKSINDKDKAWYQNMAAKDKERYKKEMEQMNKLKEFHKLDNCELKRPKKCLSSYMIFVREVRAKVTQEFPDMNALDVMKEVGRRWQNISEEDKAYYQALADKDKERFKKENQQYMKELEQLDSKLKTSKKDTGEISGEQDFDEEPGNATVKSQENDSKVSVGANGKKMRRDPNMPKKPLSAYIYFSQEMREQIKKENPKMPVASIMKEVSNRWSAMSKEEKERYVTEAREDKKRYEKELSQLRGKGALKNVDYDYSKDSDKPEDEYEYEEENEVATGSKQRPTSTLQDGSWGDKQGKYSEKQKKKDDNKVQINLSAIGMKKQKEQPKDADITPPQSRSPKEAQFRFDLPDNKPVPNMNQSSPLPFRKDTVSFLGSNYNHHDTASGSTDNQQNNLMYRPNIFSPTPFGQNRSPGVSPNMVPMYSPMLMRGNDSYREYSNRNMNNLSRNPSAMGQSGNVNRNETPYNDYNLMNMSPGGFTPLRTSLQKNNPMFSPPQNAEGHGLFGPSPSVNNMLYTPFGYGRTPVNQLGRTPMSFMNRTMNMGNGQNQDSKNRGATGSGLFDLNPFGN